MSGGNNDMKEVSACNTHSTRSTNWVDIDLGPRKVDTEPYIPKSIVIGQVPRWSNFELESNAPRKKRLWLRSNASKIVVGVAIIAMLLIGIIVPTAVAVAKGKGKGVQRIS